MKPTATHRYSVSWDQRRRFRKFKVVEATSIPKATRRNVRPVIQISYSTVSFHCTWKGAQKAAHRLNAEQGNTP